MLMTNPGGQLEARFLSRLLDALGSSASPLEFAAPVVAAVADTMGGCCALWLVERPSGALRLAAIHDDDPQRLALVRQLAEEWPSPWPDTVSRQVAALVQPIEFTMGSEEKAIELLGTRDRALLALRAGIASVLLAPLRRRGRRLGLLAIASPDSGSAPDSRNLALATEAAQQLSVALDLLRQIEMFRRSSEELALTSLRLRTILESIPQGVMVMDADNGRVTFANPPLLELIDRPKDTPSGDLTDIDLAGIASPQGEPRSPEDIPWIRSLRSGESTPSSATVSPRPSAALTTFSASMSSTVANSTTEIGGRTRMTSSSTSAVTGAAGPAGVAVGGAGAGAGACAGAAAGAGCGATGRCGTAGAAGAAAGAALPPFPRRARMTGICSCGTVELDVFPPTPSSSRSSRTSLPDTPSSLASS